MGSQTVVIFKIFPEEIDSVAEIEAGLKEIKEGELKQMQREPIAFGLEAIKVAFVIPDKVDGAMDSLEQAVRKIKGVNEVEVEGVTLL